MKILRNLRLLLSFYRACFIPNFTMTLLCLGLFWEYGFSIFSVLFWGKLAAMGAVFLYIRSYRANEFYYYLNLGLSKVFLWTTTLSFDFGLYLFLLLNLAGHRPTRNASLNYTHDTSPRSGQYSTDFRQPVHFIRYPYPL